MLSLLAVLLLANAETVSDMEIWNRGVAYYRTNDWANAMQTFRPLVYSKGYSVRAAEVLAKLEYEHGDQEEAAVMAQIALRANPKGERENHNFTLAVTGLEELRENRRIEAALQAAKGKPPGDILLAATKEVRELLAEAGTYRTNEAARAIALGDMLSARTDKLSDAWIPVRTAIVQSVTNENDAATILQRLDDARALTRSAARKLGNFEDAYPELAQTEDDFTAFLKLCILPPAALGEDLAAQSNACIQAETVNGRDWQQEALDYTRAFRMRFPEWARNYEQQAQSDTNLVAFTEEDQAKISALATELEKLQLGCVERESAPEREKALELIREIRELMPKNRQNGKSGQDGNSDQDRECAPPPEADEPNGEEQPEDKQQEPSEPEDRSEREIEALLKKAEERNEEHEAEKKAMMRKAGPSRTERDW